LKKRLLSLLAVLTVLPAIASDKDNLRQKILYASHFTRIDDVDMKPWHMKVNYRLNDSNGQMSETGSIEEWWAGLSTWKLRIESPSYTGTIIENKDGDFRTESVGPIPLRIRGIEREIVYPMPMGEDFSETVLRLNHQKLEKVTLDCIWFDEPPIPPFPRFCFDQGSGSLHAIISANSSILVRDRISQFEGHAPALSIKSMKDKISIESAEVVDLSQLQTDDDMFKPSPDMKRVTGMHTLRITKTP
jgi:hypothetical protein